MVQKTKKSFKSYAAASAFVKKLGLQSMQDWIDFSKGKNADGNVRPKDIPSNPWTVYRSELEAKGAKFSINKFIGAKRTTGRKAVPNVTKVVTATRTPRVVKVIRTAKSVPVPVVPVVRTPKVAPSVATTRAKPLTYAKAKSTLKKMHVGSRADFNAAVRMRILPKNFPKNPVTTFKAQWKGWKSFLGTR